MWRHICMVCPMTAYDVTYVQPAQVAAAPQSLFTIA